MTKKFKLWKEQSELKQAIKYEIDKGICVSVLQNRLSERFTAEEVYKATDELLKDWLIIPFCKSKDGDLLCITSGELNPWLQVTEFSNDGLLKATGCNNMSDALMFLLKKNVWHPDMDRYGITEDGKHSSDVVETSKAESSMRAMPADKTAMSGSSKIKRADKAQSGESSYQEVPEGAEQISSSVQDKLNSVFEKNEDETCEFSTEEIFKKTDTIDPKGLAMEIGTWLVKNVEEFIDNHETLFRIYLPVCAEIEMPNCSLFQRLYMAVQDDGELWDALDLKLSEAKTLLDENKEFNTALFKRMSYFYEMTGFIVGEGQVKQALTQEMQGSISINELMFDPIMMTTTVSQGVGVNTGGVIKEGDKKVVIKQEEVPAGFALELEICLRPKQSSIPQMY